MKCQHCNNGRVDLLFTVKTCEYCNGTGLEKDDSFDGYRWNGTTLQDPRRFLVKEFYTGNYPREIKNELDLVKLFQTLDILYWTEISVHRKKNYSEMEGVLCSERYVTPFKLRCGLNDVLLIRKIINAAVFMASSWYRSVYDCGLKLVRKLDSLFPESSEEIPQNAPTRPYVWSSQTQVTSRYRSIDSRLDNMANRIFNTFTNIRGRCIAYKENEQDCLLCKTVSMNGINLSFSIQAQYRQRLVVFVAGFDIA